FRRRALDRLVVLALHVLADLFALSLRALAPLAAEGRPQFGRSALGLAAAAGDWCRNLGRGRGEADAVQRLQAILADLVEAVFEHFELDRDLERRAPHDDTVEVELGVALVHFDFAHQAVLAGDL